MKRFLRKIIIFCLLIGIASTIFCIKVDPFNVFHALDIKDNGVEPNKNYIKMTYILNNPDKFDSFVFGSSRVGNIHTNDIWGQNAYNMTYSEALPCEILANVKTLIENGVTIKHLYVGVDNLSYTIDPSSHLSASNASYELSKENPLKFCSYYLDPAMVFESLTTIINKHEVDDSYAYRFYEFGWNSDYGANTTTYDFDNATPSISDGYYLDETLDDIRKLVELCNECDINLVIFTNPMYYVTYDAALKQNYLEFLKGLSEITEFCNFSGYNDIALDSSNWIDNSHYTAEVSQMVLECACFHAYYEGLYEQGFGVWINNDNFDTYYDLLKQGN